MSAAFEFNAKAFARFRALCGALNFDDPKSSGSRAVLTAAGRVDRKQNKQAFQSSGRSLGKKWDKNHPRWHDFKLTATGSSKPLIFTGRLRESLTKARHPDRIREIKDGIVKLGTRVPYAGKHRNDHRAPRFTAQAGGKHFDSLGTWRVPARDFLMRGSEHVSELSEAVSKAIIANARKAWQKATGGTQEDMRAVGAEGFSRIMVLSRRDVAEFLRKRTAGVGGGRGGLR